MSWLLLVTAAWGGDTWWVTDEATGDELRTALATTWPEREIEVVVGSRPEGAAGTTWDGMLLVSYSGEGVRHADVDDPTVAALLARSWALPATPITPERYLPKELPPVKTVQIAEIEEPSRRELRRAAAVDANRYRLETGFGTRSVTGQPRVAEGLRLVNELERDAWFFQTDAFVGMSLRWAPEGFVDRPEEGVIFTAPLDRGAFGLAVGVRRAVGPVSVRALVGPEVRFVEEWLFFRGIGTEFAPHVVLGGRVGVGADLDLGRFVLAPLAFARVDTGQQPFAGGASLDLRFQWRR